RGVSHELHLRAASARLPEAPRASAPLGAAVASVEGLPSHRDCDRERDGRHHPHGPVLHLHRALRALREASIEADERWLHRRPDGLSPELAVLMKILGISAHYHDSAAALLIDGVPGFVVQEERISRRKNDAAFPLSAIEWCLDEAKIQPEDLDAVVFYEKPMLKFERILSTTLQAFPYSWKSF